MSQRIQVAVSVVAGDDGPGRLELREGFELQHRTLDELISILSQFHELAERIRDEQAGLTPKK